MSPVHAAVGVVMPTHGENPFLVAAVESVRAQNFTDWRLVIVCDGVTDETGRVADAFATLDRRIRVVRQHRLGVAEARNRGIAELGDTVDFVAMLDHDDRWLPGALLTLSTALSRAEGHTVGAHGLARFIDASGAPIRAGELERDLRQRKGVERGRVVAWPLCRPTGFANLVIYTCIPVGTALVSRAALERVGQFDPRAVPADDYDMWLRLSRLGDFEFLDEVVMEYRQHAAPTWKRPRGRSRGLPYVRRKILSSPDNSTLQVALARQGYLACETAIVTDSLREALRLAGEGRYRGGARQLLRAVLHAAAYAAHRALPAGSGGQ